MSAEQFEQALPGRRPRRRRKEARNREETRRQPPPSNPQPNGAAFTENEMAAAKQNNVNVRAQAHINGEVVVYKLQAGRDGDGEGLEEVVLPHPKTDEPGPSGRRSSLPAGNAHAGGIQRVSSNADKTVKPSKLNVRGGPGENYSVIGLLHKGDAVKEVGTKGGWTEIEPRPTNAYAFVAAHLLDAQGSRRPPPVELTTTPPAPTPQVLSLVSAGNRTIAPAAGRARFRPSRASPGARAGAGDVYAGAGPAGAGTGAEEAPPGRARESWSARELCAAR